MQRKLSQLSECWGKQSWQIIFLSFKPDCKLFNRVLRQFSKVSDLNGPITRAAQEGKNEAGTGKSTNSIAGLQDMDTRKLILTFIWNNHSYTFDINAVFTTRWLIRRGKKCKRHFDTFPYINQVSVSLKGKNKYFQKKFSFWLINSRHQNKCCNYPQKWTTKSISEHLVWGPGGSLGGLPCYSHHHEGKLTWKERKLDCTWTQTWIIFYFDMND